MWNLTDCGSQGCLEQPQVPFGYAQGRLSTPSAARRSLRMTVLGLGFVLSQVFRRGGPRRTKPGAPMSCSVGGDKTWEHPNSVRD